MFTENEKIIARNIDKEYEWMARNKSGSLNIYTRKPIKGKRAWTVNRIDEYDSFAGFKYMFSSVKWEDDEPTRISDIYDPQVLDEAEREYLKTVLEPFREEVDYVKKIKHHMIDNETYNKEYLYIKLYDGEFTFPDFDPGKMYAGMERDREYKLDELGIKY